MSNDDLPEPEGEEEVVIDTCPNCGRMYDEIDIDYLICHRCGYDAENKTFIDKESE